MFISFRILFSVIVFFISFIFVEQASLFEYKANYVELTSHHSTEDVIFLHLPAESFTFYTCSERRQNRIAISVLKLYRVIG
jgi:hypothetical protein